MIKRTLHNLKRLADLDIVDSRRSFFISHPCIFEVRPAFLRCRLPHDRGVSPVHSVVEMERRFICLFLVWMFD